MLHDLWCYIIYVHAWIIHSHKLFIMLHSQSLIRQVWQRGHTDTIWLRLCKQQTGWRAFFFFFFSIFSRPLQPSPAPEVNNVIGRSMKTPVVGFLFETIATVTLCLTSSSLENHFLPSICISHHSVAWEWHRLRASRPFLLVLSGRWTSVICLFAKMLLLFQDAVAAAVDTALNMFYDRGPHFGRDIWVFSVKSTGLSTQPWGTPGYSGRFLANCLVSVCRECPVSTSRVWYSGSEFLFPCLN